LQIILCLIIIAGSKNPHTQPIRRQEKTFGGGGKTIVTRKEHILYPLLHLIPCWDIGLFTSLLVLVAWFTLISFHFRNNYFVVEHFICSKAKKKVLVFPLLTLQALIFAISGLLMWDSCLVYNLDKKN
jgi:hypothetical protein